MDQAVKNLFFTEFYVQSLFFNVVTMFDQPFVKVFGRDDVFFSPCPSERNFNMVYIFLEWDF